MLTFLTTYFELGLIFCIIEAIISWFDYGPAFTYTFDSLLKTLLTWPIFLFGLLLILLENIKPKNKLKDEQHLYNNSQED